MFNLFSIKNIFSTSKRLTLLNKTVIQKFKKLLKILKHDYQTNFKILLFKTAFKSWDDFPKKNFWWATLYKKKLTASHSSFKIFVVNNTKIIF